jgi:hypothetical protein
MLEKPGRHRTGPVVGMVGTDGLGEEIEKAIEVVAFRLGGAVGSGGSFKLHVEIEPGQEAVGLVQSHRRWKWGFSGNKSGACHAALVPQVLLSRKGKGFGGRKRADLTVHGGSFRDRRYIMTFHQTLPARSVATGDQSRSK